MRKPTRPQDSYALDLEGRRRQAELVDAGRVGTGPGRRGCARSARWPGRGPPAKREIGRRRGRPASRGRARRSGRQSPSGPRPISAATRQSSAEAAVIVRPVAAVRPEIGIARPRVEMRGVERPAGRGRAPSGRAAAGRRRRTASPSARPRSAPRRAAPAPPDSPAAACAPRRPSGASAPGSAPATSARPPVLTSGKSSEATERTRSRPHAAELVDHRLGDQADALVGAAEALRVELRDPRRPRGLRGSARRGR